MIPVHALLVEDNKGDAALVQRRLAQARRLKFGVDHVEWLSSALTALKNRTYDIIFVDLTLPDSNGVDTVMSVKRAAPNTPVIVLSGREDLDTATNSVRAGAQSFMVKKADMDADELERDTLYAMERARNEYTSKELLRQSVQRLTLDERPGSSPPPPPNAILVVEHVTRLEEALDEIRAYLRKNHPAASDAVESILEAKNTLTVLQELRSLLSLGEERHARGSKISDRALRAVREMSTSEEMTKSEAESALLELIGETADE